jgi:uncharacterized membrane protein
MQKFLIIFFILIITFSCSKKEEVRFEAFNPEAFAYDIGDIWEVNATVNVRGFEKNEKDNKLFASLDYSIDVVNPHGEIMRNIFSSSMEFLEKELSDVQLEAQFELEKTYNKGVYEIVFNIKDNLSGKTVANKVNFELED